MNIGERQKNRTSSNNIVNSSTDYKSIERAFLNAFWNLKDKIKNIFYKKNTSYNISHKINKIPESSKKAKSFMKLINQTYIIAEAGVNHNGSMKYAARLIAGAKKAGANAIKFQNFISENLVTKNAPKAKYQIINTKKNSNQLEMLQKLELKKKITLRLLNFAKNIR